MEADDVRTLARLVKAKARSIERQVHELRRLAAQLEDAATDTSTEEETDVSEEARRSHAHA